MTTEREPPPRSVESLRALGFRAARGAAALLTHAHQSHFGPSKPSKQLVVIERRAGGHQPCRRTKAAALGAFKPSTVSTGTTTQIDRALIERLLGLDFIERGDNVLLRGSPACKSMLARPSARPLSNAATASLLHSRLRAR